MVRRTGKRKQRSSGDSTATAAMAQKKQSKISSFIQTDKDNSSPNSVESDTDTMDDISNPVFNSPTISTGNPDLSSFTETNEQYMLKQKSDKLDSNESLIMQDIQQKLSCLGAMQKDMGDLKKYVEELIHTIQFSENQIKESATEIANLKNENKLLSEKVALHDAQTAIINQKIVDLEDYSRRENILISGVAEEKGENCLVIVQDIFNHLNGHNIEIQRCHRTGRYRAGEHRDIIVRLVFFQDKVTILQRRSYLPRGVYINEDFSPDTKRRINALRPVLKEALKHDRGAKMIKDKLLFQKKIYSLENIKSIGFNLEKLSEKQSNDSLAFAGRYSPLSNLYPHPIKIDGTMYQSSEHYYQFQKCLSSGDVNAASAVMTAKYPEDAMAAGNAVKKSKEWTLDEGRKIMRKAIITKFSSPAMKKKLLSTGNRIIAEAKRNPWWGVGEPLTSSKVLNPTALHGCNQMGLLLMLMRDELNKTENSGDGALNTHF